MVSVGQRWIAVNHGRCLGRSGDEVGWGDEDESRWVMMEVDGKD